MNKKVLYLVHGAVIAALYVVLTMLANALGLANYAIQVRFSEALTILPVFTPAAIPGLFLGCIISNTMTGCMLLDIIFGSLATLIGAFGTYLLRDKNKWLAPLPPIIANTIIVPFVLAYVYHLEGGIPYFMLTVGIGEVISCAIEGNQITLSRIQRSENGSYQEILNDQIMNNVEEEPGQNKVVTADIDIYERYVQIQTKTTIDTKTIKVLNPKEVVFEGGRELTLDAVSEVSRYYVYNAYGVQGIYSAPGKAVKEAYDSSGVVTNDRGITVWLKGNRVSRNQIMAIKEESVTDQKNSLTVCLDNILRHAGITRNTEYDLAQGKTAIQILEENMTGVQVLDLSGCSLDAVLYYVNQDIPVLAILEDGEAVLVTGFNEFNVVIMEPSTGKLYKKGMNDATAWFAENGNHFITYMRTEN